MRPSTGCIGSWKFFACVSCKTAHEVVWEISPTDYGSSCCSAGEPRRLRRPAAATTIACRSRAESVMVQIDKTNPKRIRLKMRQDWRFPSSAPDQSKALSQLAQLLPVVLGRKRELVPIILEYDIDCGSQLM